MLFTRFVRFVLVGGFATTIQYALLVLLVQFAGVEPVLASAIGFVVSAFANYIINYHYTFVSNQRHTVALPKFSVLASIGLALNSGIMSMLVKTGLHYILAQIVATIVVLLWNFGGNSLWTFRSRVGKETSEMKKQTGGWGDFIARNRHMLLILLLTAAMRALVALASDNRPGDPDMRAILSAMWAFDPTFIYSTGMLSRFATVWLPFHFYVTGFFTFFFGDPIVAGKWVSFLTGTLSVIPFFRLTRRLFDERTAVVASLFFAVYGNHIGLSSIVMSEAPFCFFALWGLAVFFEELKAKQPRWRGFFGAAVLISLAGGFRQEGWQLAGILALYMLLLPSVRKYAVPFGLIGISTFIMWTVGNIAGGHSVMYSLTNVAAAKDHETLLKHYSGAMNAVKWLWMFIQSPGPLITGFTLWGYVLAFRRRLPLDLAVISFLLIGPYVLLSVVKPEWAPQHRYTVLFGILMLPYAAAAVLGLLPKRLNLATAVAAILGLSVAAQAAAYTRHSKRGLPFHDYVPSDVTLWTWLAANKTPEDRIIIEDTGWRAPGVIVHSESYRQSFTIVFPYEGPEALEKAMGDTRRPYLLVLHSPPTRWPFLEGKHPSTVFKTEDYTVMRVAPDSSSGQR